MAGWLSNFPMNSFAEVGFRVAMIPEPGTALLVMMGLFGLAMKRSPTA